MHLALLRLSEILLIGPLPESNCLETYLQNQPNINLVAEFTRQTPQDPSLCYEKTIGIETACRWI